MSRIKIDKLSLRRSFPIVIGAALGYAYYYFIGCSKGCSITGNPWMSTLWGGLIGSALVNWKSQSKDINTEEKINK
jgi:xanthine/uracil permease